MAITAEISASLSWDGTKYYQSGNTPIPVVIKVYNSDPAAVQLRQVYLTQTSSSLGTGASLSLGDPVFRYIPSPLSNTNNIIPAGGTGSYSAIVIPQVNALTQYPTNEYLFSLTGIVQRFGYAETTRATPATFQIRADTKRVYSLVNNFQRWSQFDNKRPPQNIGFDYQLYVNETLENGETYLVPQNELYYSSSNPSIATIVENTPDELATTGSNSQLSASGGCIDIKNIGAVNFVARRYNNTNPVIASGSLQVISALPIAIEIEPNNSNHFYDPTIAATADIQFKSYVRYSNGERIDWTGATIWDINNSNIATFDLFVDIGKLTINNSNELITGAAIPVLITATFTQGTYGNLKGSTTLFITRR